jgi:Trk-type K+ transport system membrane component
MGLILGKWQIFDEAMKLIVYRRWLGIFNGVSAFNNSGMSLLDANIVCPDSLPYHCYIRSFTN